MGGDTELINDKGDGDGGMEIPPYCVEGMGVEVIFWEYA